MEQLSTFDRGYTFILNAHHDVDKREESENILFKYFDDRSNSIPHFKAAVWTHFGIPNNCNNAIHESRDHYHVAMTGQKGTFEGSIVHPGICHFSQWLFEYRNKVRKEEVLQGWPDGTNGWPFGPNGQKILSPKHLMIFLAQPPKVLMYYTDNLKDHAYEQDDIEHLFHIPVITEV